YLLLYAADLDVQVADAGAGGPIWLGDSFRIELRGEGGERVIEVAPDGAMTEARRAPGASAAAFDYTWRSQARAKSEIEGTINDTESEDEEWLVEMAIPFASIGAKGAKGETIDLAIRRCDVGGGHPRSCGSWGETPPSSSRKPSPRQALILK